MAVPRQPAGFVSPWQGKPRNHLLFLVASLCFGLVDIVSAEEVGSEALFLDVLFSLPLSLPCVVLPWFHPRGKNFSPFRFLFCLTFDRTMAESRRLFVVLVWLFLQFAFDFAISVIVSGNSNFLSNLMFEILLSPLFPVVCDLAFNFLVACIYFPFSPCPDGLQMINYRSLLGDATWNFPLLIHDRDELNKLAFIAQFLGSYTYRVSHPPSFCIR